MVSFHRLVRIGWVVAAVAQEVYLLGLVPMAQLVYSQQFLVLILHMLVVGEVHIHKAFKPVVEVMPPMEH
jgi:hypothetical protein